MLSAANTADPPGVAAGAAPTLQRSLGLGSVVVFGLAYMAPLIVLATFGVLAQRTDGAAPSAYLLALVAILFTAAAYGRMVRTYPVSGSAYSYVRRTMGARVGFIVGWVTLLDYFLLPMVIWLLGAAYLSQEIDGVPSAVWIVAFIVFSTAVNVIGLRTATLANVLLMLFQLIVLAVFVGLALGYVAEHEGTSELLSSTPLTGEDFALGAIAGGAAVAAYSFLGFDAVTTLTEETHDPARTLPRAILLIALIGGAIFVVASYVTQLVHPGGVFADEGAAAYGIAGTIGGGTFQACFTAGLVVTQLAAGIAAQTSASRLMYVMGRDGVLPRRLFGALHPRWRTPVFNLVLTGAVGLIGIGLSVSASTSFIDFGAFTAFTFVNLSVIALWLRARREGARAFSLVWVAAAVIGAAIDVWLLVSLDVDAHLVGGIWLVLGLGYLVVLTRGLRRDLPQHVSPAEAPAPRE